MKNRGKKGTQWVHESTVLFVFFNWISNILLRGLNILSQDSFSTSGLS